MNDNNNILIIDDDENFADTTNDLLLERGFESEFVLSGQEGIELLKEKPFGCVLLDMKMPVLNGLETFREIKKVRPQTVVIMCTAFSMDEMIEQSLNEGVYSVLRKPLDLDRVVGMIKKGDITSSLVMVADNDPKTRESLKNNLLEYGYRVSMASTGAEAIQIAKEQDPSILFIDTKLPPINGLEVFLEVKKLNPNVKVIMLTEHKLEVDEIVDTAVKEGAYGCIEKPFGINQIVTLIEKIASIKPRVSEETMRNIKVLVVDDQQNALESLGDLLEEHGFYTIRCLSAEEALQKAKTEQPDVVIADIKLADGNGFELCMDIKALDGLEIKTIIYSGHVDSGELQRMKDQGIDDFCVRTNGFQPMLDTIKSLI